jgi:hypothetical protein
MSEQNFVFNTYGEDSNPLENPTTREEAEWEIGAIESALTDEDAPDKAGLRKRLEMIRELLPSLP